MSSFKSVASTFVLFCFCLFRCVSKQACEFVTCHKANVYVYDNEQQSLKKGKCSQTLSKEHECANHLQQSIIYELWIEILFMATLGVKGRTAFRTYLQAIFWSYFPPLNSQWILINIYHLLVSKDPKSLSTCWSDITSN